MILKTVAFLLVTYFLIKLISRMFIPASTKRGARIIFRTIQNMQKQQQQNRQRENRGGNTHADPQDSDRLEEIEEAEFEDVTDKPAGGTDRTV